MSVVNISQIGIQCFHPVNMIHRASTANHQEKLMRWNWVNSSPSDITTWDFTNLPKPAMWCQLCDAMWCLLTERHKARHVSRNCFPNPRKPLCKRTATKELDKVAWNIDTFRPSPSGGYDIHAFHIGHWLSSSKFPPSSNEVLFYLHSIKSCTTVLLPSYTWLSL